MITPAQAATSLSTIVSLSILLIGVFYFHRNYFDDAFRQKMFNLRNELFDWADEGGIAFDNPAYVLLRQVMNGYLSYAHRMSLLHLFLLGRVTRKTGEFEQAANSFQAKWEKALESTTLEQKAKLLEIKKRLTLEAWIHTVRVSPFALTIILAFLPTRFLAFCFQKLTGHLSSTFKMRVTNETDSTALTFA